MEISSLTDKLVQTGSLDREELVMLIGNYQQVDEGYLFRAAQAAREQVYGRDVYLRGLIEISNYCKNDCFYCGIRKSNRGATRYRLEQEQILTCCAKGYALGLRTFVLQSGEDPYYAEERMVALIRTIKERYPDCALTLSLGEQPASTYRAYYQAGADRYLLRHETANAAHYAKLHPPQLSFAERRRCLSDLKQIGFQVGSGFMVGSPGQDAVCLADDLLYLQHLQPQMVGIGPFIPHAQTPFAAEPAGTASLTVFLLAVLRLLLPAALLPATTALGTVRDDGWEQGILAGANVIMPNLTPPAERRHYLLYNNKNTTSAEESELIATRMHKIGYQVVCTRGDYRPAA